MGLINTTGYFKGTIISGALGVSSGELPQEEWALKATEIYDGEGEEYLPVDDEHDEITAYLPLRNHNRKESKNCQQVKKIIGWDGASFSELREMDRTDIPLSFRVEYGNGDYADRLGVGWVDMPDATPGRSVSTITKEDADALQVRYADVMTKAPVKAVSAKGKGRVAAAAARTTKPPTGKKGDKPKGRPTIPKTTTPEVTNSAPIGECSADDAYNACFELKRDDVSEQTLNELWQDEVKKVNKDETKITPEEWFKIKETLLVVVSKV